MRKQQIHDEALFICETEVEKELVKKLFYEVLDAEYLNQLLIAQTEE
jgi:hypothetical protein